MEAVAVTAYLCANAQIFALEHKGADALAYLDRAEKYKLAEVTDDAIPTEEWRDIVEGTRGFILEQMGERAASRAAYEKLSSKSYIRARLAVLDMLDGDNVKARERALDALASGPNPTASLVLARLAETRRDVAEARDLYDKAWLQLQDASASSNSHFYLPLFFCDGTAIATAKAPGR
jgi:hypothetical protein